MSITKEKLLDTLYTRCLERGATSKQIFDWIVKDLGLIGVSHTEAKAIEVIRPYKLSGRNLELTVNLLYDILTKEVEDAENMWY